MILSFYGFILGFLTAKVFAGPSEHTSGPLGPGVILPFHNICIHVHHWIIGFFFMALYLLIKISFFQFDLTDIDFAVVYFFIGLIAQGIIDYRDWREIVVKKHK